MEDATWTLDELAERVDAALAVDYEGQPSGRVRSVPDRRAIRWYTTIGLVDRPGAHRGRTALYGPRHLLQLVAVKRLQARGLSLVAIQQELAGATDEQLARVARVPAAGRAGGPRRAAARAAHPPEAAARADGPPGVAALAVGASPLEAAPRGADGAARRDGFWRQQPAVAPPPPDPIPAARGGVILRGVRLGGGATLLLDGDREPGPADLRAILDAARPLLGVLRERGLGRGDGSAGPAPGSSRASGTEPRREHR